MIEKESLRKHDFVTSIVLIILSIGIFIGAMNMPMTGMYGGVQNNWYMSPALFPIIISFGLFGMNIILLVHSITTGGAAGFIKDVKRLLHNGIPAKSAETKQQENIEELSEGDKKIRLLFIILMLFFLIFLLIPRVDFLISLIFFLFTVMAIFTINEMKLLQQTAKVMGVLAIGFSIISFTNLDKFLLKIFPFSLDLLTFAMTILIMVFVRRGGRKALYKKELRTVTLLAILVPLLVTVTFRYGLLVPLPVEGLFFNNICNTIYYSIR